jgi:hypothetical protein
MRFSFPVASLTLLLAASAGAAAEEGDPSNEEMVVFGDLDVARKRNDVLENLKAIGYRKRRTRNGRTLMVNDIPWRPNVVLDDDGYVFLRRAPVRIDPPGNKDNKLRYLWCLPPFTVTAACIRTGGQLVSPRKLGRYKEDVARATGYEVRQWRDAIVARAMEQRLDQEIPDLLADIWERGLPGETGDALLLDAAARRGAILQLWASRSCTAEGAQVRERVADFFLLEVQASGAPATSAEIRTANASNSCGDALPQPNPEPSVDAPSRPN